ncbi:MAG: hypothetical protein Q9224_004923 [Gallowayella concinna]
MTSNSDLERVNDVIANASKLAAELKDLTDTDSPTLGRLVQMKLSKTFVKFEAEMQSMTGELTLLKSTFEGQMQQMETSLAAQTAQTGKEMEKAKDEQQKAKDEQKKARDEQQKARDEQQKVTNALVELNENRKMYAEEHMLFLKDKESFRQEKEKLNKQREDLKRSIDKFSAWKKEQTASLQQREERLADLDARQKRVEAGEVALKERYEQQDAKLADRTSAIETLEAEIGAEKDELQEERGLLQKWDKKLNGAQDELNEKAKAVDLIAEQVEKRNTTAANHTKVTQDRDVAVTAREIAVTAREIAVTAREESDTQSTLATFLEQAKQLSIVHAEKLAAVEKTLKRHEDDVEDVVRRFEQLSSTSGEVSSRVGKFSEELTRVLTTTSQVFARATDLSQSFERSAQIVLSKVSDELAKMSATADEMSSQDGKIGDAIQAISRNSASLPGRTKTSTVNLLESTSAKAEGLEASLRMKSQKARLRTTTSLSPQSSTTLLYTGLQRGLY